MATNKSDAQLYKGFPIPSPKVSKRRAIVKTSDLMQRILPEELFLGILCLERKRAERSNRKFLLLLLETVSDLESPRLRTVLNGMIRAANQARRETDPAGWYKEDSVLGVIFTELDSQQDSEVARKLLAKVREAVAAQLKPQDASLVTISVHIFADDSSADDTDISERPTFYPDILELHENKKIALLVKRAIDVIGSLTALILFSPLFLLIGLLVKLTSKGPVLFQQERLGQFGKTFHCLKFRSMYANNDPKIHQAFMKKVINGQPDSDKTGTPVVKMKNDPRITSIGKILRRTSLDELPQFINVLRGEMSLVGPRPPLPYEYREYNVWHRRRVLEIKPGITGLWQVRGRGRVRFDEMVRLDLQYARGWSLWLDVEILLKTPAAVVSGDGAY
ncbi:MAG TPA: exopolysaccharide biosynthesis polyprenyl glycosylphosphotransferase [Verrucomicrobiae bacterium]|nr:exopolysaccharide biosynthesis polyprenyl glycosylphosphotransferase [Verrucomicrobiae bacterium]